MHAEEDAETQEESQKEERKMKPHSMIARKLDSIDTKLDEIVEEVRKWQNTSSPRREGRP